MKHISEIMTAVCKEHGITMNQGDREMSDAKKEPNFISCEPEWHGMFNYAIHMTKDSVPKGKGMETIVEMLLFGQRLYTQNEELKQLVEQQRKDDNEDSA